MKRTAILAVSILVFSILAVLVARSSWMQTRYDESRAPFDTVITFDTSQVTERVWYGSASGDVTGNVTLEALNDPPQLFHGTWAGTTRWQITAGSNSFTADMRGKINTYNGTMTMMGKVLEGANPGARVVAQGQVTSINPHHFVGTIRVQP